MYKLVQTTYREESLPAQFKQELDRALKSLTQDMGNLSGFVDKVAKEADQAKSKDNESQTFQATAGMQAVEIERLRSQVEELGMALGQAEQHNEEVQRSYQNVLLSVEEQKQRDHQQLKVRSPYPELTYDRTLT